jgi:hypothetical protein
MTQVQLIMALTSFGNSNKLVKENDRQGLLLNARGEKSSSGPRNRIFIREQKRKGNFGNSEGSRKRKGR